MCTITIYDTENKAFCQFKNVEKAVVRNPSIGQTDEDELETDDKMISYKFLTGKGYHYFFYSPNKTSSVDGKIVGLVVVEKEV